MIIELQSYVYVVDASQWSMGSVYVCFGTSSKRKAFKISSIICVSFCIFCVDLVGRCVLKSNIGVRIHMKQELSLGPSFQTG